MSRVKTLIVYYSRTGNTARVAKALEQLLDADMCEIRCDRYSGGLWRYLLAGYDSVVGRLPAITLPTFSIDAYDLVLIGTPVWTSHPSLPVRAFAAGKPRLPDQVGLFFTYGGHSPAQTAIDELTEVIAGSVVASLAIKSDQTRRRRIHRRRRQIC